LQGENDESDDDEEEKDFKAAFGICKTMNFSESPSNINVLPIK